MNKLSLSGILTKMAGLSVLVSDATFSKALDSLFGAEGSKIIAIIGVISVISGELMHIIGDQPPDLVPPVAPAPILQQPMILPVVITPAPAPIPVPEPSPAPPAAPES